MTTLATNVPGLNKIGQNEENCLMVPPNSGRYLAKGIIRLLENPMLARRPAKADPASVEKFDMKYFVDYLTETYQEMTNKK